MGQTSLRPKSVKTVSGKTSLSDQERARPLNNRRSAVLENTIAALVARAVGN